MNNIPARKSLSALLKAVLVLALVICLPSVHDAHAQATAKTSTTALTADDRAQIDTIFMAITHAVQKGSDLDLSDYYGPDLTDDESDAIFHALPYTDDNTFTLSDEKEVPYDQANATDTIAAFTATESVVNTDTHYTGTHSAYFDFEKDDGQWYLADTDFYKYIGYDGSSDMASDTPSYMDGNDAHASKAAGWVLGLGLAALALGGIISLLLGIFWVWMLVTILQRTDMHSKILWFIVVFVFGPVGAIVYYFADYRPYVKAKKVSDPPSTPPTL